MTPRTVAAGNGWSWIADGFNLFTKNPVMWVVITLVMVIGVMIVSLIPLLGGIAVALLWPVLAAGLLLVGAFGLAAATLPKPKRPLHRW